ncbi:MAG: cache domain-containing protein [Deferribacterales bacterium]
MTISKVPVWIKVILPITASMALFIFIIFGVHMPEIKTRLLVQKKEQIRDLTQAAVDIARHNYMLYASGKMTENEAKQQAIDLIADIRFGPETKDYFWITDYEPKMVMHPYRPDLNGKDLKGFADPAGQHLFMDMVKVTENDGEGFTEYMWQWKDDSTHIVPKISFVKRFPQWHWIIGTGVYMEDLDAEVSAQAGKLLTYTMMVFVFILLLSGYVIYSAFRTNRSLMLSEHQLRLLNEKLEDKVRERTNDLEASLDNLKKTQSQLIESEKMASLGNLVAGVAHEINTPIGIGVTSATFLEDKLKELKSAYESGSMKKSDLDKFLDLSEESVRNITVNLLRAANLIKSFKQVAVDQSSEMRREFNLKHYLGDILMSLRPKLKTTRHQITINAPEELIINSYPGAFMQIFSNLIMNSLIHGFEDTEQGKISIDVKTDGKDITIVFADNGHGMTQEQLNRIYEPFYTTKRNNGGSGLGMNVVYNLVTRKLGGTIFVSSEEGKGSVFIITLPGELNHEKHNG